MRRAWLFVLLASCDASEPLPYVPTYDPSSTEPVSSTEFCSLLARNTCAMLRPCCDGSSFSFDEQKCRTNSRLLCEARKQKSMELGLLYDDVQAGRCVRGMAIMLRDCKVVQDDPVADDVVDACRNALHGTAPIGGACDGKVPVECAPPELGVRVACAGQCVERSFAESGEPCDPSRICRAGTFCDGTAGSRCTSLVHAEGSPCDPCPLGPCPADLRCGPDGFCDGSSGTRAVCRSLPGKGEACDATRGCARPWRCDTDKSNNQLCTEGKPLGSGCDDDAECASRLCIGFGLKLCAPPAMGPPIATESLARGDPQSYLTRTAAACDGIIPDGAGGLAPLLQFPATTK